MSDNKKVKVDTEMLKSDRDRLDESARKMGLKRATLVRLWLLDKLNSEDSNGNR